MSAKSFILCAALLIASALGARAEPQDFFSSVENPDGGSFFRFQTPRRLRPPPAENTRQENDENSIDSLPANAKSLGSTDPKKEGFSQAEKHLLAGSAVYSNYELEGAEFKLDPEGDIIPFTIIGEDDRWPAVDTRAFPASAITEIVFRNDPNAPHTSKCTGAMIASEVLLTAGHCVHSGTREGHWYSSFQIVPGRNTADKYFGVCGAAEIYALNGWIKASDELEARYYDLGAIRLDCSVGNRTGWFGLAAVDAMPEHTVVQGYSAKKEPQGRQWVSSRGQVRAVENPWPEVQTAPLKLFYQNDTYGGTSGAPVLRDDGADDEPLSVAEKIQKYPHGKGGDGMIFCVHTNGRHGSQPPWSDNNACTIITPERLQTIANWVGG